METKTYARLADGQLITSCAPEDDMELIDQLKADGFKLYDENAGEPEIGPLQTLNRVYFEEKEKISLYYEIIDNDPERIKEEIARLGEQIAASDYKVVKSYEYALIGQKVPYDAVALHSERQALRDRIGVLQDRLSGNTILEPEDEIPPGVIHPSFAADGDIAATPI